MMEATSSAAHDASGTRLDVRGQPLSLQHDLLAKTFQLLRPGQFMLAWLDAEDEMRAGLERCVPRQFAWTHTGDHVTVGRTSHPASDD